MRRVLAIAVGFGAGVVLSGLASAALVRIVPPPLRGATLVWSATALIVSLTTALTWVWSWRRGR